MRVVMRYGGPALACGDFNFGEVEDYTIKILPPQFEVGSCPPSDDFKHAPPNFSTESGRVVFVDISKVAAEFNFDVAAKRILAKSRVFFQASERGLPVIDLIPDPSLVKLNGHRLPPSIYRRIPDPDGVTEFRMLDIVVAPNVCHTLELGYEIPVIGNKLVQFDEDGVEMLFDMLDISGSFDFGPSLEAKYWEQFGPTNLEFDHYEQDLSILLSGANAAHRVFSNGELREVSQSKWQVSFPEYFTTSSFYLHIGKSADFRVLEKEHQGIPIQVYTPSTSPVDLEQTFGRVANTVDQIEQDFGAYPHRKFVAHLISQNTSFGLLGIEFAGATVTRSEELEHEIFHSWFARGVMPANGSAGWIDEALALWFESGYSLSEVRLNSRLNLVQDSPYSRGAKPTPLYEAGAEVIATLVGMLRRSGVADARSLFALFYAENVKKSITTDVFKSFLERETGFVFDFFFDRYVFGKDVPLPWHHRENPEDVNKDGIVSSDDVIRVMNYLNDFSQPRYICAQEPNIDIGFLDVTADCYITTSDVLRIINRMNYR